MGPLPLRYLSATDVGAAMPGIEERLALAERTMLALTEGAQLPPKIGVQPREAGSFAHAMPALLGGGEADGSADLLGMKWVTGFPSNVSAGLPAVHGTTILSDARSGQLRAIVDAGALTAARTAALSGVAIRRWGPRLVGARSNAAQGQKVRVALVGAGAQARSHLPVVAHLLPGAEVVLCDVNPDRADALARGTTSGLVGRDAFGAVHTTTDPVAAVADADLVLTLVSFGPLRQAIPTEAFATSATVVAVDYDMCVPATLADSADLFLVDHREQYLSNRSENTFVGYPDVATTIGEAMKAAVPRPAGRVLVTHLGVGLADVVFADAILRVAESRGIGTILER